MSVVVGEIEPPSLSPVAMKVFFMHRAEHKRMIIVASHAVHWVWTSTNVSNDVLPVKEEGEVGGNGRRPRLELPAGAAGRQSGSPSKISHACDDARSLLLLREGGVLATHLVLLCLLHSLPSSLKLQLNTFSNRSSSLICLFCWSVREVFFVQHHVHQIALPRSARITASNPYVHHGFSAREQEAHS